MENVLIRHCTAGDIEGILKLESLWAKEENTFEFTFLTREEISKALEHFPEYILVAELEGQIIGYINGLGIVNQDLPVFPAQSTYLMIENLYVHPSFRDRLVGGDLLEKLLDLAKGNGISQFSLNTDTKDMARILRFYERFGFKPWHVKMFKTL